MQNCENENIRGFADAHVRLRGRRETVDALRLRNHRSRKGPAGNSCELQLTHVTKTPLSALPASGFQTLRAGSRLPEDTKPLLQTPFRLLRRCAKTRVSVTMFVASPCLVKPHQNTSSIACSKCASPRGMASTRSHSSALKPYSPTFDCNCRLFWLLQKKRRLAAVRICENAHLWVFAFSQDAKGGAFPPTTQSWLSNAKFRIRDNSNADGIPQLRIRATPQIASGRISTIMPT